jgi:tetratricopeptide (TPR) repeat protein
MGGGDGAGRAMKRTKKHFVMRLWAAFVVTCLAVVANGALPGLAHAQLVAQAEDFQALDNDAFNALELISEAVWSQPQCPWGTSVSAPVVVTGKSVSIACGWNASFAYSETRIHSMRAFRRYTPRIVEARLEFISNPRTGGYLTFVGDEAAARRFAAAWSILAGQRAPTEPSTDAGFVASVQSEPEPQQVEALRRVQVQVEAAIRANRTIEAARLYRDALRTAPAWAEGHFNLGLLYGELELYPEAITEMRRYLYLAPNAPDARAVQDRIYEWEAALAR